MSLSQTVAALAADNREAARNAHTERVAANHAAVAAYVAKNAGMPAHFARNEKVAVHEYKSDTFRTATYDAVKHETLPVVQVDDMEFVVTRDRGIDWDGIYPLFHDVDHGYYRASLSGLFIFNPRDEKPQAEVFIAAVAEDLAKRPKHPAVIAAASGSTCHGCGRGWDQ